MWEIYFSFEVARNSKVWDLRYIWWGEERRLLGTSLYCTAQYLYIALDIATFCIVGGALIRIEFLRDTFEVRHHQDICMLKDVLQWHTLNGNNVEMAALSKMTFQQNDMFNNMYTRVSLSSQDATRDNVSLHEKALWHALRELQHYTNEAETITIVPHIHVHHASVSSYPKIITTTCLPTWLWACSSAWVRLRVVDSIMFVCACDVLGKLGRIWGGVAR